MKLQLDCSTAKFVSSLFRKYFHDHYTSTVLRTLHAAWLFWRNRFIAVACSFRNFACFLHCCRLTLLFFEAAITPCALVCRAEWKVCSLTAGLNQNGLSEITWSSVQMLCTSTEMPQMCTRGRVLSELERGTTRTKCSKKMLTLWSRQIF